MSEPRTKITLEVTLPDDPIERQKVLNRLNDKEKLKQYLKEKGFDVIDSNVSVK